MTEKKLMIYKNRELRRLWEVEVYKGDPDDEKPKTKKETVIAFNAVEANRLAPGPVASEPVAISFVTWDDEPLLIEDTSGPTNKKAKPTITVDDREADWED